MTELRERLAKALAKPVAAQDEPVSIDEFDPWSDVLTGICGSYSSDGDAYAIKTLCAIRDKTTFDLIVREGFIVEFMLYVFAGHGYVEYGTSPRGGWWDHALGDTLQPLIDKWTDYAVAQWGEDFHSALAPSPNGRGG